MFALSLAALSLQPLFGSVVIHSYICQPPITPVISSPADNSTSPTAAVVVSGDATADTTVVLTDNGATYGNVTADQSNEFAAQLTLDNGSHTIGISSSNPCGSNTGDSITITVDQPTPPPPTTPPTPSQNPTVIVPNNSPSTSPQPTTSATIPRPRTKPAKTAFVITQLYSSTDPTTFDASTYVYGATSQPATIKVTVNGKVVATTSVTQTGFGLGIPLSVGVNKITVTATAGDEQITKSFSVTRNEQAPQPSTSKAMAWYSTTIGKTIIISSIVILILIILAILLI